MRLLATDLDGTLFHSDLTVSTRARAAIAAADAAGIIVVAATGRSYHGAVELLRDVPEIRTVIGSNGAIIRDLVRSDTIYFRTLHPEAVATVNAVAAELVPEAGLAWELVEDGFRADARYLEIRADMVGRWPNALVDVPVASDDVLKVLIRDPDMTEAELLARLQPHLPDTVEATYSGIETVEVTAAGVHKASALQWLCAQWGIAAADVTAMGDNRNDIEMLRWAGYGVAMGTATPDVVAAADAQTAGHDHDGAALVIEAVVAAGA